jgi:FAD/FMN-containing dehydrogenase
MKGISIHESFQPRGCKFTLDYAAVTVAAGSNMGEINLAANSNNLTLLSAGKESVGCGGYITGGGPGAVANAYGLAAENVLEVEVVTPGGEILTINERQNQDLFWAICDVSQQDLGI